MRRLLLTALAMVTLSACGDEVSSPGDAGLRVVAAPVFTDTVDAYPQQMLVVEVRDERGVVVQGVEVVYTSVVDAESPAEVTSVYASRLTNEDGRASTRVQFGTEPGVALLRITVPELDLATEIDFRVQAGRPVQISVPDQALTLGDTIQPTVFALDRYGNASTLPPTLSEPTGPLALSGDDRLYGTAYGTGTVEIQVLTSVASATVSVVPPGWLAGYAVAGLDTLAAGIHRLTLDGRQGSVVSPVTLGMPQPYGIDWSPDGLFLAYGDIPQNRVILVNTATGAVAPLAGTDDFTRAHSPQFSADGSALYFWGRRGDAEGIWRVPPTGGVPVLYVADAPADAHISANGEKIAYAVSGQVLVQDVASGAVDDIGQAGGLPRMSPDGRRVAFIDAAGRLAIFSLATRALRTVAVAATPFTIDWSPLGAWLLVGGSSAVELVQLATLSVLPLPNYLLYPVFRFVEETVPPND